MVGRDRLPDVQEELRHVPGVTVIVYDQRCAAEARRMRRQGLLEEPPQRVVINEAVCEGCGDCNTKSNCLSVLPFETEFGEKRRIHESSCNRDYTCLDGDCPSFVTITPARGRSRRAARDAARDVRPSLPAGELPTPPPAALDGQYGICFTGVGGTGVVTANRIVAAAAEAAGYAVGGMDQTGLSQMAGAVVSHLHVAADATALGSAAVGAGGADLYLSGDLLQAASPVHLEKVSPGRTLAVIDRDVTRTAAMLQSDLPPPDAAVLEAAVTDRVGADRVVVLHAKRIAEAVFGNHLLANVVLLGAAFQAGALPLSLGDVERGIGGTGRTADDNRAALEWGRWAVHDPAAVERAVSDAARGASGAVFDPSPAARNVAERLVARARHPGGAARARHATRRAGDRLPERGRVLPATSASWYGQSPATTRSTDGRWPAPWPNRGSSFSRTRTSTRWRASHLLADYGRVARDLGIEGRYSVSYHLHPPVLRRMGLSKKMPLGKPYEYAFRALRGMKRLRGTPFDVFGWDPDRRTERALIEEYERLVYDSLSPAAGVTVRRARRHRRVADGDQGVRPDQGARRCRVARGRRRAPAARDAASAPARARVIKRITFANRAGDVPREVFAATSAPDDARPARVTVCTALPGLGDGEPAHDVIGFEWFTDVADAERFEGWLEAEDARIRKPGTVLVADELVLRGANWLEQRWRDGGERLKHMAIALRCARPHPDRVLRALEKPRGPGGPRRRAGDRHPRRGAGSGVRAEPSAFTAGR